MLAPLTRVNFGRPLLISMERRGTIDGKRRHEFFTNVCIELKGSDIWIEAK